MNFFLYLLLYSIFHSFLDASSMNPGALIFNKPWGCLQKVSIPPLTTQHNGLISCLSAQSTRCYSRYLFFQSIRVYNRYPFFNATQHMQPLLSRVNHVTFNVQKDGKFFSCITIDEISLEGNRYTKIFVDSPQEFDRLNLHRGDVVQLFLSQDRRPFIVKSFFYGSEKQYKWPDVCPKCYSLFCQEDCDEE